MNTWERKIAGDEVYILMLGFLMVIIPSTKTSIKT